MKVLVLWEKPAEIPAAQNLAVVLNKIGQTLMNARVVDNGAAIQINPLDISFPVDALAIAFESLADFTPIRPPRPQPPNGMRDLIFPDED